MSVHPTKMVITPQNMPQISNSLIVTHLICGFYSNYRQTMTDLWSSETFIIPPTALCVPSAWLAMHTSTYPLGNPLHRPLHTPPHIPMGNPLHSPLHTPPHSSLCTPLHTNLLSDKARLPTTANQIIGMNVANLHKPWFFYHHLLRKSAQPVYMK